MNKKDREREKEIKRLMYVKSQLIKETKKELMQYRNELKNLGNQKKLKKKIKNGWFILYLII